MDSLTYCKSTSLFTQVVAHWFEIGVVLFLVWMLKHAWQEGRRWAATLVFGVVFGVVLEVLIVNGDRQGHVMYKYCTDIFWAVVLDVPIAIGVGWGIVLYASAWTAQRLELEWYWRPFAAALLAISIDLTLDPLAHRFGLWTWLRFNGDHGTLIPDKGPGANTLLDYYGVPYDNFLGWFLVVFLYTFVVRLFFNVWDYLKNKRRSGERLAASIGGIARQIVATNQAKAASRMWGRDAGRYGAQADAADILIPLVSMTVCVGILYLVRKAIPFVYAQIGEKPIFLFTLLALISLVVLMAPRASRLHPKQNAILFLPLFFHGSAMLLMYYGVFSGNTSSNDYDTLVVALPFHALGGFIGFAWPSLAVICPPNADRARARSSDAPPPAPSAPAPIENQGA